MRPGAPLSRVKGDLTGHTVEMHREATQLSNPRDDFNVLWDLAEIGPFALGLGRFGTSGYGRRNTCAMMLCLSNMLPWDDPITCVCHRVWELSSRNRAPDWNVLCRVGVEVCLLAC